MNDSLTLTDEKVLTEARETLAEHLQLQADGYKCQTTDLLNVLLAVATDQGTIESVCSDLPGLPKAETMRQYINEELCVEDLPQLQQGLNHALAKGLPPRLWRRPQDMAIDFHDRPYYGKKPQEEALWVQGRAKDGTTRFYRIASAYLLVNNLRFTLAVCFVLPEQRTVDVLRCLLEQVQRLRLHVRRLLLDRGFAGVAVQSFLEQEGIPALIACPIRGKKNGTRPLCHGRRSYRAQHTFKAADGQTRTADIAVCRVFTTAKRTGRLRRRAEWHLFILINLQMTPAQVRRLYRRRFGVETSYRCAAQVRGWTTSPNPAYRFFLMALGLLLVNVWLSLRWRFTQRARRGGRWLDVRLFRLDRFAKFILRALQRRYHSVHQITATVVPLL